MKRILLVAAVALAGWAAALAADAPSSGLASWYGENHRGKLMANGKPFDPDQLTAASWFYPLGMKIRVTARAADGVERSVVVTITDRGPNQRLIRAGRIIDLAQAAFNKLAPPETGMIRVTLKRAV